MRTRLAIGVAAVLLGVTATAVVLAQSDPERPADRAPAFRVEAWPANEANRPYHELVERHLNEMAAEGWTFHSTIVGQGAKMMVFERSRQP